MKEIQEALFNVGVGEFDNISLSELFSDKAICQKAS